MARLTARTVEVFLRGERIPIHGRGSGDGKHTTVPEYMPSSHRRYADWTIERIRREADAIGPSVRIRCVLILERRAPRTRFPGLRRHVAAGAVGDGRATGRGGLASHRDRRADL